MRHWQTWMLTGGLVAWCVTAATGITAVGAVEPIATADGVALAIIYDTSGSMGDSVRNASGQDETKDRIARRAMAAVVTRLEQFVTPAANRVAPRLAVAVYVFRNGSAVVAVPMQPFDAGKLRAWLASAPQPNGSTPLGESLAQAAQAARSAHLSRPHVLVITDGINTVGRDPALVLPSLLKPDAAGLGRVDAHFIAFDVAAAVFKPLKDLGATVVSAADERQLNEQLTYLLQQKILLEDEEPARRAP